MQRNQVVHQSTFPARLEAVDQLRTAVRRDRGDPDGLRAAATAIDEATTRYSDKQIAVVHSAFAELLRVVAQLVEWRAAVLAAGVEADRFQRAAQMRLAGWKDEYGARLETKALTPTAEALATVPDPLQLGELCRQLALIALPVAIDGDERRWLACPHGVIQFRC